MPGAWVWKINDSMTAGVPDLLIVYKNGTIFIEVKTTSKLTKLQAGTLYKIGRTAYLLKWSKNQWELSNLNGLAADSFDGFDSLVLRIMKLCEENQRTP